MTALIRRHLCVFFKDRMAVFFSLMAVFVVIGLYIAFLGDMMIEPLEASFGDKARELSDNWIIAGTLGTVALTTSMSALGVMIEDKSKAIDKDFQISPISKRGIMFSYLVSTFLITFLISLIALAAGEVYIIYYGGEMITLSAFLRLCGVMIINIITCTSILLFVMSFFKSASSFSNATTIVGTLSGFLMGIYVPCGALPSYLQSAIRLFPPSHGASLYRNIMMDDVIHRVFSNQPIAVLNDFREQFGLDFYFGSIKCSANMNLMILGGTACVFIVLLIISSYRRHLK